MVAKEFDASAEARISQQIPAVTSLFDTTREFSQPSGAYLIWVKPALDRIGGSIALILAIPVLIVLGLSIWLSMGRPVFFAQERVGLQGQVFRLWKFRTMEPDRRTTKLRWIGEEKRKVHKSADDPRITPLGRWLRRTRLDEIPQLINVVMGDLSLVGPRPELVEVVAEYEPWQHRRHAVKPGITGLWQISDDGEKLLRECTALELEYLDEISLGKDLSIIFRTFPAMARRSGI